MENTPPPWVEDAFVATVAKVERLSQRIGPHFVHASVQGRYRPEPAHWWTAGFWPGLLWLAYGETQSSHLRALAESLEEQLDQALLAFTELHHDVGFMWTLTSVARYQTLGEASSLRRGLMAATLLAGRFNPAGGFIRAWGTLKEEGQDRAGWSIIDTMMNLSLLFWAFRQTADPRFYHVAVRHADTVLREFIRQDGACHHIVRFDPATGQRIEALAGQGYAADSAWSRGAAWALYGMTNTYRHTQDKQYFEAAARVAGLFSRELARDPIPFWDFRLPTRENMPRDTSAACIAASALIDLARLAPLPAGQTYHQLALRILHAIYTEATTFDEDEDGIVLHGTGHFPHHQNVDVPLIYGDYFFLEALAKLRGQNPSRW